MLRMEKNGRLRFHRFVAQICLIIACGGNADSNKNDSSDFVSNGHGIGIFKTQLHPTV